MRYLLRFGLLGSLTFLSFFIYFYKSSGKFRNSIIAAFAAVSVFLAGLTPAHGAGEVDAFMPKPNPQRGLNPRPGLFSGRSTTNNHGSGPEKPDDFGSDGLPEFPQTESVERTK